MTNIKKENLKLKKEVEKLKLELKESLEQITKLEEENELLSEPVNIEKVFDSLPFHDSVNILAKFQANTFGRMNAEATRLENQAGLIRNNIEIMQLNAKHINEGRIYTKG